MRTARKRALRGKPGLALAGVLLIGALLLVAGTSSTVKPAKQGPAALAVPPEAGENEGALGPATPDEFFDLRKGSLQTVTKEQVRQAQAQAEAVPAAGPTMWQEVGPANIGGRTTDIVADVAVPNRMYAAVSGGGIWRSDDSATTFKPAWPADNVQNMGAVDQGPDGTLWAGTGEANPPGGGLTYFGDGLYKSTDAGDTWTNVGLRESEAIGRIQVDPTDANTVWVAAAGHIARSAQERGIYKTEDAGKTWQLVLAPPNATTGGIDLEIDPSNTDRVYAALWDHKRNSGARTYGGIGSGLFKTEDGGKTWKRLQNIVGPLAPYDTVGSGLTANADLGRIAVTVAPSDPSRVYVAFGTPYGPDKGFYFSDDYGESFRLGGRAYQSSSGYQWWFGKLWVDPTNKNHLFNADVQLRESLDGGMTWRVSGGLLGGGSLHVDQHGMDWDPRVPNRIYLGNDGGIYRSDQNGAPQTWVKGPDQPFNQSYHLDISPQDEKRMVTGLQDNGSVRTWQPNQDPTNLRLWNAYGGGDGHKVNIDPTNKNIYYQCLQPAPPAMRCTGYQDNPDGTTTSWGFPTGTPMWPAGMRWTTDMPVVLDPSNPEVVYAGGNVLGRSTDRGRTFTMITPTDNVDYITGPVPPDHVELGPFYVNHYATISAIAPAKSAPNTIYIGTDTGRMWKTTDLGANWTRLQGTPERWVNAIQVDPDDANHVFAAFSGYRMGEDAANVYETFDGGATWSNVSYNLPNGPVEWIIYDAPHSIMYAATDAGVFTRKDGEQYWYDLGGGLPNAPVLDVRLSGTGKTLYAATFGRSIWKLPLSVDATDGGGVGGSVPATLSLTLGAAAGFGAFTPGVDRTYNATTTANVVSTAGEATLSVTDASANAPGRLVNGAFSLAQPVEAKAESAAGTGSAFAPVSGSPLTLLSYVAPISNDEVTLSFQQRIAAGDALRTGSYGKTLTYTLSTTTP